MLSYAYPALCSTLLLSAGLIGQSTAAALPSKVEASAATTTEKSVGSLVPMVPKSETDQDSSLQTDVNLFYGSGKNYFASMNCPTDGDNQKIVAMHSFSGLLQSVDCSNDSIQSLTFKDAASAKQAEQDFDWVNKKDSRSVIMISDWEGCGVQGRAPYEVNHVKFGTTANGTHVATLTSSSTKWAKALPNTSVHFSSTGLSASHARRGLDKRLFGIDLNPVDLLDGDHTFGIPLSHDFSKPDAFSTQVDGITIGLGCSPCLTAGTLNFDLDIVKLSAGTGNLTVTPSGIEANATLAFDVTGVLNTAFNPDPVTLLDIPIDGIDIANVVKIGPQLTVDFGVSMTNWTAEATASIGVSASIPDDSVATVDFQDSTKNTVTDFVPQFSLIDPVLSASLSASAEVFTEVTLELDLTFDGFGVTAGLGLKVPDFQVSFDADASTNSGACNGGVVGAELDLQVGLDATAFVTIDSNTNNFDIFNKFFPLFDHCFAFGGSSNSTGSNSTVQRRSPSPMRTYEFSA